MSTTVSYEEAGRVLAAALARAAESGSASCVAILDAGRNLVAFARQDGAILAAVEVSQAKAYTAASLAMPTADLAGAVQPGGPFYGLAGSHGRPYIPFGGGLPLHRDGRLVGAIGVGGGSPDQDADIAAAGAGSLTTVPA